MVHRACFGQFASWVEVKESVVTQDNTMTGPCGNGVAVITPDNKFRATCDVDGVITTDNFQRFCATHDAIVVGDS